MLCGETFHRLENFDLAGGLMWEFVEAHPVICYVIFSALVGALPSPGRVTHPVAKFLLRFLNLLAANVREFARTGKDRAADSSGDRGSGAAGGGAVRFTERGV